MKYGLLSALVCIGQLLYAQTCENLKIEHQADITSKCTEITMTMIHDQRDEPFLYVANKEGGLTVYDVSTLTSPSLVTTIPVSDFDNLHVMSLSQSGNYLFLALGNHFGGGTSKGGMAIVDVTDPKVGFVTDYYIVPGSESGGGIVKVEGELAYLGAMKSGLIILDVGNVKDIQLVSQFVPDINYPVKNPNPDLYNARGMEVKDGMVYLCYDAGGIRIIDCTDPQKPVEKGKFSNSVLHDPFNLPRAYNNLVLDGNLLYVAVDYCGVEILDISDLQKIKLKGWWNPNGCPTANWFTSPIHTNEIQYDPNLKKLFLSTGESDMVVLDVSDPSSPDSCTTFGGIDNKIGTWGISMWKDQLYLSYICTFGVPFASNWSGVKILTFEGEPSSNRFMDETDNSIGIFPNPATNYITITAPSGSYTEIGIYNSLGHCIRSIDLKDNRASISIDQLPNGMYFVRGTLVNGNPFSKQLLICK